MSLRLHCLERSQRIPRRLDEVFAFFADASSLEAITPPFLHFRILSPLPIEMRPGARIDFRREAKATVRPRGSGRLDLLAPSLGSGGRPAAPRR